MATKDQYQYLTLNNKKNDQYQNLNLNHGRQYFGEDTISSRVGIYDSKKVQNYIEEKQRKECSLWNKKDFISRNLHNFDQQEIEKEKSNIGSSSTLSLHITAYENTKFSDSSNRTLKNADLIKKCKDAKKIFENTTLLNGFELPRQQENDPPTPEIMQFKASKKLADPTQETTSTTQSVSCRNGTTTKGQLKIEKEKASSLRKNAPPPSKTTETKAANVQAASKNSANKKPQANKHLPASGDSVVSKGKCAPSSSKPFNLNFPKKYFSLTPNEKYWFPPPVANFKKKTPQMIAFAEKTKEMGKMITKTTYMTSGTFGSISKCEVNGIKQDCVIKILKNIQADAEEVQAELNVYSTIDSPYFPKMLYSGIFNTSWYCIVTELINGGTIDDNESRIEFGDIKFIAYELAMALNHLHGFKLTHGDLKGNNIALTADGHVRLFDFGLSRKVAVPVILPLTPHMAPEVRAGQKAGVPADIFSYGSTLFALMHKNNQNFDFKKMKGGRDAKDFVDKCMDADPQKRLKNPLQHSYLKFKNKIPSYIPGVFIPPPQQQPCEELEKPDNLFCLKKKACKKLFDLGLFRFPSEATFKSFK